MPPRESNTNASGPQSRGSSGLGTGWSGTSPEASKMRFKYRHNFKIKLGTGGVQGQVKGQRLMGIKAVNDSIGLATCQNKIYEK